MAHFFDHTIFTALAVLAAFCLALNATGSLLIAMLAGFLAPYPLRLLLRGLKRRIAKSRFSLRRTRRRRAAETVRCWSVARDETCRDDILTLLRAAYPASADRLCPADVATANSIPVFTLMTLRPVSEDAMADHLRRIREAHFECAVIAASNEFSPEARALALLPNPCSLALIDGEMLIALLTRHPQAVPFRTLPRIRPQRPVLTRAHALKMLPIAAFLLAMYYLFGLPLYLPAALALIWGILFLLKRRPAPASLF